MTYAETCDAMAELGHKKGLSVTRTPLAYLMGCVLAGAYIGVALIVWIGLKMIYEDATHLWAVYGSGAEHAALAEPFVAGLRIAGAGFG